MKVTHMTSLASLILIETICSRMDWSRISVLSFLFMFLLSASYGMSSAQEYQIGAVVDYSSRGGKEERVALDMAVNDFFARESHHPTLKIENSHGDPIQATSSAKTLIKENRVRAIIGLGTWQEAVFVAELGNRSEVPIISLSNDVPFWANRQWPFLVNTARSQFAQMKAVAAIVQSWQWRKVNIIYEDINSAISGIIPYLIGALQEVNSEITDLLPLPPLPRFYNMSEKLETLKKGQCRVFIVHTSMELASIIFMEAKKMGMMDKEFVWITTISITDELDSLNASTVATMQGVLGVQSYFPRHGKQFEDFQSRFQVKFSARYPDEPWKEPGIFALQAYDSVRALTLAMYAKTNPITGRELLERILQTKFKGLTGEFNITNGKMHPADVYRIVNVVGKSYNELGFWSKGLGFSETIGVGSYYNKSMSGLGQVFWPGGPWSVPRGWALATDSNPLIIGVPTGATFKEFVNVTYNPKGDPVFEGFTIEVFNAMVKNLPYSLPYKFVPYNGTYDSLVKQVGEEIFGAVVGDTSIVANRCAYAEFSQPYSDSGLQMLVYDKSTRLDRAWLFTKPFTTPMWVLTVAINVYNGFVVWLIERNYNPDLRGSILNQIGTMLSLAFTTLFSLQGERLHSNLARMAMIVWLFVALVITQSFTASLTTLLTVQNLNSRDIDVGSLIRNGDIVGCDGNSFVVKYLEDVIGFKPYQIRRIYTEDEYPRALKNGEIAAAFMEMPYAKLFLAKNCHGFSSSGQPYSIGGFGFVFPRSSPYLPDVSEAVLKLAENGTLRALEESLISSHACSRSDDDDHDSLGIDSFWGLFVVTAGTSSISLFLFLSSRFHYNMYQDFNRRQQQHEPEEDETTLFAWEMEQQGHWS